MWMQFNSFECSLHWLVESAAPRIQNSANRSAEFSPALNVFLVKSALRRHVVNAFCEMIARFTCSLNSLFFTSSPLSFFPWAFANDNFADSKIPHAFLKTFSTYSGLASSEIFLSQTESICFEFSFPISNEPNTSILAIQQIQYRDISYLPSIFPPPSSLKKRKSINEDR